MKFIYYPKCSTCQKALKDLQQKNVFLELQHIVEHTPSQKDFVMWIQQYGQGVKPFFNTSGLVYREMKLKDKINNLSVDEAAQLLSSHGMLVKRPLLIDGNNIIIGYKKEIYEKL